MSNNFEHMFIHNEDKFHLEYMTKLKPVMVSDLFLNDSVRTVKNKTDAIKLWKNVYIPLTDEYDNAINIKQIQSQLKDRQLPENIDLDKNNIDGSQFNGLQQIKLSDYFSMLDSTNYSKYARVNFDLPDSIYNQLTIPDICMPRENEETLLRTKMLFGCRGSFSQVHFDKDGLHGLLYQVYGRKRFIIIPYTSSKKMMALTQFGGWFIQNFTDEDRINFLNFVGGKEIVLEPGDALYIPPFCWHYADYLTDCCAINIRFRCDKRIATLLGNFFPDQYLPVICSTVLLSSSSNDIFNNIMQEIKKIEESTEVNEEQIFFAKRRLAQKLYLSFVPGSKGDYYFNLEQYFPSPLPYTLGYGGVPETILVRRKIGG